MSAPDQSFRYAPGPGLSGPQLVPSGRRAGVTYCEPEQNGAVPRRAPTRPPHPSLAQQSTKPAVTPFRILEGFPTKGAGAGPPRGPATGQQRPPNKAVPRDDRRQPLRPAVPNQITIDIAQASRNRAKSQPLQPTASSPQTPSQHTTANETHFPHRSPMEQQLPSSPPSASSQRRSDHGRYQQTAPTRPGPDGFSADPDQFRVRIRPPDPLGEPNSTPAGRPTATQRRSQSSAPHSRPYSAQGMRKETSAQVLLQQAWEMEEDRHAEEVSTLRTEITDLKQQMEIIEQISSSKEQETSRLQVEVAELAAQLQEDQAAHDLSLENAKRAVALIRQKSAETESSFQALLQVSDDRVKTEIVRLEQKLDEACMAIEAGEDQGEGQGNRSGRLPAYHDIVARYTTAVHNSKRATETAKTATDELRACERSIKEALEKAKDKAEGLLDGLKKERDTAGTNLSQTKAEWTEEKKELREDVKQLRIELNSRNNDIAILMAEKAEVIGQLTAIKVERDAADAKHQTAKEEVVDVEERLRTACGYLEKAGLLDSEGEYDELAQQAMDEQQERHRSEIEKYQTRMDSLSEEVKRLAAELSKAEEIASSSQEKSHNDTHALQQARQAITQLETKLAAKENEVREHIVADRTAAQQLQSQREELQATKLKEKQAKTDLEKEMTTSNKGQMQIVALKEKIVSLEKQVTIRPDHDSSVALTAAQAELIKIRQEFQKAQKEVMQYESQLAQADETALERKEEIEKLAGARVELIQELADSKKLLVKSQQTVEEQAGRLKAPTAQVQQELAILKEEHEKLRKLTGQKEADVAKRWNEGNLTAEEKKIVQLALQVANESWTDKMKKKDEDVKKYKQDAARLKADADAMYKVFHNLPSSDSSLSDPSEGRPTSPAKLPTAEPSKSSMATSRSGDDIKKKKARFANLSNTKSKDSSSSISHTFKNADAVPPASLPESIGQFSSETNLDTASHNKAPAPKPISKPAKGTTQRKRKAKYAVSDSEDDHPKIDANQPDQKRSTRSTSRTPSLSMASQLSLPLPLVTQNPDKLHRKKASGSKTQETVLEETEDDGY